MHDYGSSAEDTARCIRRVWPHEASIGLVLGTGAARVAEAFEPDCELSYADLPHMVPATAVGHPGRFLGGRIGSHRVAILQGRVHLYEGYSAQQVQFPVHVLAALSVRTLILTNASGGLNINYRCGDLVVIDDLVDLTHSVLLPFPLDGKGGRGVGVKEPTPLFNYNQATIAQAKAHHHNMPIHRGTYIAVLGPNYETRAEYRFLRRIGDVVGMSTVHEVRAARAHGMDVLGLSVVSNECCPDRPTKTTGESVVWAVEDAADRLTTLIVDICNDL